MSFHISKELTRWILVRALKSAIFPFNYKLCVALTTHKNPQQLSRCEMCVQIHLKYHVDRNRTAIPPGDDTVKWLLYYFYLNINSARVTGNSSSTGPTRAELHVCALVTYTLFVYATLFVFMMGRHTRNTRSLVYRVIKYRIIMMMMIWWSVPGSKHSTRRGWPLVGGWLESMRVTKNRISRTSEKNGQRRRETKASIFRE